MIGNVKKLDKSTGDQFILFFSNKMMLLLFTLNEKKINPIN